MRNNMLIIFGFVAEWLLFTFSLYQAVVEISEQRLVLNDIDLASKKYRNISPVYWLFPPLKIWLEKKRVEKILHDITVNRSEFDRLFSLSNRAIAWAYISLAEIFIAVISTSEVIEILGIELSNVAFIGINLLLICLSILVVVYRTSDFIKNRIYKRYRKK